MFYDSVEHLSPTISSKLSQISIVGMKYYADAHEKIIAASHRDMRDQCLFLVADVNNRFDKDAVMLHNGVSKLGYVAAAQSSRVRRVLEHEARARGYDAVIVVTLAPITAAHSSWISSFTVKGVGVVYERIARKFAAKHLKEN